MPYKDQTSRMVNELLKNFAAILPRFGGFELTMKWIDIEFSRTGRLEIHV